MAQKPDFQGPHVVGVLATERIEGIVHRFPPTLDDLVSGGYLRSLPKDPFTSATTTWQTVPAEPDPINPTVTPGVYDVKSGSEASALDGTKYSDW